MANESHFDLDHLARLARLALSPEEKQKFASQLAEVLQHMARLEKVDVTGIEPMAHAVPIFNVWSEDVTVEPLPVVQALANAPVQRDNFFVVPKVVE